MKNSHYLHHLLVILHFWNAAYQKNIKRNFKLNTKQKYLFYNKVFFNKCYFLTKRYRYDTKRYPGEPYERSEQWTCMLTIFSARWFDNCWQLQPMWKIISLQMKPCEPYESARACWYSIFGTLILKFLANATNVESNFLANETLRTIWIKCMCMLILYLRHNDFAITSKCNQCGK